MKKSATVSIPSPCSQNWDAMPASGKGRHCDSCQKTVIDFRHMSDGQILDIISGKGIPPCGRYLATQLDRPLVDTRLKTTFAGLLAKRAAALLLLVQSATTATAQQAKNHTTVEQYGDWVAKHPLPGIAVKGMAINAANNLPLAGAGIYIHETGFNTVANIEGEFNFDIDDTTTAVTITVKIRSGLVLTADSVATYEKRVPIVKTDTGYAATFTQYIAYPVTCAWPPPVVEYMGTSIAQPQVVTWSILAPSYVSYTIFRKPVDVKLPVFTPHISKTSLWGRLTGYWMGKKTERKQ